MTSNPDKQGDFVQRYFADLQESNSDPMLSELMGQIRNFRLKPDREIVGKIEVLYEAR